MVEEFRWPLDLAASCGFWRGTALVTTARVAMAYYWLFSQVVVV
jgi:hypothetical protein